MKKKVLFLTLALLVAFSAGALASSAIKVVVNGKTANTDAKIINGSTYVPLRAVSEMLGANVNWDNQTKTVNITTAAIPAESQTSKTVEGVTVEITKVEQDDDSLKVYVKYTNHTNEEIASAESLSKIVVNGKQYDYDIQFNFERYYDQNVPNAPHEMEPGVTAESVLFFDVPSDASTVNITLSPNYNDVRFNSIPVK